MEDETAECWDLGGDLVISSDSDDSKTSILSEIDSLSVSELNDSIDFLSATDES